MRTVTVATSNVGCAADVCSVRLRAPRAHCRFCTGALDMSNLEAFVTLKRLRDKRPNNMSEVTNLDMRRDRVALENYLHAAAVSEAAYVRYDYSFIRRFNQNGQV